MTPLKLLVSAAVAAPVWFTAQSIPAQAAMSNDQCQPLTADNREECCEQENWRELILPGEIRFCPPLNKNDNNSGRLNEDLANTVTDDDDDDDDTTGGIDTRGNPGNNLPVGNAGEKDGKNMNEPGPSGSQGNSTTGP